MFPPSPQPQASVGPAAIPEVLIGEVAKGLPVELEVAKQGVVLLDASVDPKPHGALPVDEHGTEAPG